MGGYRFAEKKRFGAMAKYTGLAMLTLVTLAVCSVALLR